MKVYELNEFGIDNLTLADRDMPTPGIDEVLVKFHAFSLNYRDLMVVRGEYNPRAVFPVIPLSMERVRSLRLARMSRSGR